ncbi:MAG TPA: hypothetical protein VM537_11645 [Anaerolineae bacterium]|nr:hypothetical protein [Anaerolineae bacterium]
MAENGENSKEPKKPDLVQRWSQWKTFALERLPGPYWLTVTLATLLVGAEQVLEYSLDDPTFRHLTSGGVANLLVVPLMVLYMMIILRVMKNGGLKGLAQLRPTVQVTDQEYDAHVRRMVHADWRVELVLLVITAALVMALLVVLPGGLLNSSHGLPSSFLPAALVVGSYVLLGWVGLNQVYCSIRHAVALGALARRRITVNVFDPSNLLPFGRLSLLHSLPNIGIILIPLIIFGPPTGSGRVVIAISLVGLVTLFIPLWGAHQQIGHAKDRVLQGIHAQLADIQAELLQDTDTEEDNLGSLAARTKMLVELRGVIDESPNWPFADTAEIVRVVAAIMSPLVYFLLNELIRVYLLPLLAAGRA